MGRKLIAVLLMMLVSGVTSFAETVILSPTQATVTQMRQPDDTTHQCCHSSSQFDIAPPPMPLNMPCGSQHSCCLRPTPTNSSSLPSTNTTERRDATGIARIENSPHTRRPNTACSILPVSGSLSYQVLSTVLRI